MVEQIAMEYVSVWIIELEREMKRIQDGEILITVRKGFPDRMKATQYKAFTQTRKEQKNNSVHSAYGSKNF